MRFSTLLLYKLYLGPVFVKLQHNRMSTFSSDCHYVCFSHSQSPLCQQQWDPDTWMSVCWFVVSRTCLPSSSPCRCHDRGAMTDPFTLKYNNYSLNQKQKTCKIVFEIQNWNKQCKRKTLIFKTKKHVAANSQYKSKAVWEILRH